MKSQELATEFVALKKKIDETDSLLSDLKSKKEELETLLVSTMENEGLENFRTELGMFYTYGDAYASYGNKKENPEEYESNKAKFFQWLRDKDMGDVIKVTESVHHKTMGSIIKDHGDNIPGIKATFVTKVGVRK